MRRIPYNVETYDDANKLELFAALLPAVDAIALHALALAGMWTERLLSKNRGVLIHSAAGGVGSMLMQMSKLLGCDPVIAVVGSKHKIEVCRKLGGNYL